MDNLFSSVFTNGTSAGGFFICLAAALISGGAFAILYKIKRETTKSFLIALTVLPATVAVVIMLVNGNVGAGVAVAGAFSLVRFRSAQGSAKEICAIFICMAAGLAFGMGYIAYGAIFTLLSGGVLLVLSSVAAGDKKALAKKRLIITVPEDLDYGGAFDGVFDKYLKKRDLIKVKSVNMGSMFRLYYDVTIISGVSEKAFIDELRVRNGNLEICLERAKFNTEAL